MFLKKLFQVVPKDPLTKGLDHFNQGRFAEALLLFEDLVDSEDSGVRSKARLYACEAHLNLGDGLRDTDVSLALEHFRHSAEYQPRFADLHNKVGEMCRRLERRPEAAEAFRKALAINKRYFQARLNLAQCLTEMDELDEAEEEIEKLATSCPPIFRTLAEELLSACRRRNDARVEHLFGEITELNPDRVGLQKERALGFLRKGDPESAARILEKLVSDHPRFPDLRHLLGLAYGDLGMVEEAMEELKSALEVNPKYLKARINLGILLMEEDRNNEARLEFDRVLEVDPGNPLATHARAEIDAAGTRT